MDRSRNQFTPDYAVAPGWVLAEYLETQSMTAAALARQAGLTAEIVAGILAGEAALTPEAARKFEHVLGLDAAAWLRMEAEYRIRRAQTAE